MVSSSSIIRGHYHSPPVIRCTVIPIIILATRWWKPSITLIIYPITTQLSLLYSNTDCTTDLYSMPHARTIAPVFDTTFPTIAHRPCASWRFWYRAAQSLLLYVTLRPRYRNSATGLEALSSHLLKPGCPWSRGEGWSFYSGVTSRSGIFLTHNFGYPGAKVGPEC